MRKNVSVSYECFSDSNECFNQALRWQHESCFLIDGRMFVGFFSLSSPPLLKLLQGWNNLNYSIQASHLNGIEIRGSGRQWLISNTGWSWFSHRFYNNSLLITFYNNFIKTARRERSPCIGLFCESQNSTSLISKIGLEGTSWLRKRPQSWVM